MKEKTRVLLVITTLVIALVACNLPNFSQQGGGIQSPAAPNLTLTALYEVTPVNLATATPTLPPIMTATTAAGANPTATTASGENPTVTNTPPAVATATRAPTTGVNQPTATVPSVRTRAQVVAKFLNTAPTIDGDWSEWKDATTEYPANSVVWGSNNWSGEADLASSFHIGWDDSYLYIAVKVRDDQYVQNATGENIFKGDSIEILMDTRLQEDYYYSSLSPDDFQLGIAPGRPDINGTREAYLWLPENVAGARSGVKIAAKQETGVYRVEAAIPWNVFEITPANGQHYGFALSVSDNDSTSQNLQQSMVSNDASRRLVDPTTWGDLQLTK